MLWIFGGGGPGRCGTGWRGGSGGGIIIHGELDRLLFSECGLVFAAVVAAVVGEAHGGEPMIMLLMG